MAIKKLDHINFISHDLVATVDFYCKVIGLVQQNHDDNNNSKAVDLYIQGQASPILHVRTAKRNKQQATFSAFAKLDEDNNGKFSTGALDHFCLTLDAADYPFMLSKFQINNIEFQTHDSGPGLLKQIWVLDPNGIRVELSF